MSQKQQQPLKVLWRSYLSTDDDQPPCLSSSFAFILVLSRRGFLVAFWTKVELNVFSWSFRFDIRSRTDHQITGRNKNCWKNRLRGNNTYPIYIGPRITTLRRMLRSWVTLALAPTCTKIHNKKENSFSTLFITLPSYLTHCTLIFSLRSLVLSKIPKTTESA